MTRTCEIEGCERKFLARGLCTMHYKRWRNHGDANVVLLIRGDETARFWAKVTKSSGCWLWTGAVDHGGYGRFTFRGKHALAHRVAYEMEIGPIPFGLTLDHVRARGCEHRNCVNPSHLEPVPGAVNTLRGDAQPALNARKAACIHGHEFTPTNTYVAPAGGRRCRTCRSEQRRERMENRRVAA